jgi:hypothetical protein
VLYYTLAIGDAPENIETNAGFVEITYDRLRINGYFGVDAAVSSI